MDCSPPSNKKQPITKRGWRSNPISAKLPQRISIRLSTADRQAEQAVKILVTGSAGHLGEAVMRKQRDVGETPIGVDLLESVFTTHVGSLNDRSFVARCVAEVDAIIHTATLHKPHVATHSRQDFIDTNITGTLNLLEEAVARGIGRFVFTSTTSVFGDALIPPDGAPAAWITEDVRPMPKNIYGVTKAAAEDLCQLFHRNHKLPCLVLRTSRFFPEEDDNAATRERYADANSKANEYLYRRIDLEDAAAALLCAVQRAPDVGFARYIVSATTTFEKDDLATLRADAPAAVRQRVPEFEAVYRDLGWRMFPSIDRVYVNAKARAELGWQPRYDFAQVVGQLSRGEGIGSTLARDVGSKGYHSETFTDGPFPVA